MADKLIKNRYPGASYLLFFACFAVYLAGCATRAAVLIAPPKPEITVAGIYHHVQKGETLWKISKMYDVSLEEIVRVNRILDATNIMAGQPVFVPRGQKQASTPGSFSSEDFIWPVRGKIIARFGENYNNMVNKGINIQPSKMQAVVAVRSGKVVFYTDNLRGFGKTIIIDHGDGFSTIYARNSQVFIKTGDSVEKGAVISRAGFAGRDKNVYLHFEVRKGHIPQNPLFYLPG